MSKAYQEMCPCKGCETRTVVCHGSCEKYKKWQESGVEIERKPLLKYIDYSIKSNNKRRKKK